jgi:PAS domain-containing protein
MDQSGKIIYLIAEGRDITQQYESLTALKQSEERFRLLFESSPDPCWILIDAKLLNVMWRREFFSFKSREDFMGLHPSGTRRKKQPDGRSSVELADYYIDQGS